MNKRSLWLRARKDGRNFSRYGFASQQARGVAESCDVTAVQNFMHISFHDLLLGKKP